MRFAGLPDGPESSDFNLNTTSTAVNTKFDNAESMSSVANRSRGLDETIYLDWFKDWSEVERESADGSASQFLNLSDIRALCASTIGIEREIGTANSLLALRAELNFLIFLEKLWEGDDLIVAKLFVSAG